MLDEETRKFGVSTTRLEDTLSGQDDQLEGAYSFANICYVAVATGMQFGFAMFVSEKGTRGLLARMARINRARL